jgi:eukaryotic-like serine/threonine-protein kinase
MVTMHRWQQVKELFHTALGHEPKERLRYLKEACGGDESLCEEVLSLIASHESGGSFLNAPAFEVAAELFAEELKPLDGQLIGHYRILELLGRGGMGEIYLAEDTRLDRKVALKLLPEQFTGDASRLARFQREARAASALNHPNIFTIYEIGEAAGSHFIATEFIEGETLRRRMASHTNLSTVFDVAIQVASALAAAHEAGIIHRDIKPENIMLRRDGYVKVLDFGLAKLTERRAEINLENSTRVLSNTHPGLVMGTVRYMSPEQARGVELDARTDIWSLGVVLYEMVAQRAPFEGPTMTDILAAILEREPPPFSLILNDVPPELEWIIRKALRKERDERYQTAKELLGDLRSLKETLEFEAKLEASHPPNERKSLPFAARAEEQSSLSHARQVFATQAIKAHETDATLETVGARNVKRRRALLAVTALVALVAAGLGLGAYKYLWAKKAVTAFEKVKITQLTSSRNLINVAISPDGNYMAYTVSDRERHSLWLRQVAASNDTLIVPPAPVGYWGVTFSRDGKDLYYVVRDYNGVGIASLYRVPALGGTPRKVLENLDSPVSFSPDGKRMTFVRGNFPKQDESALVITDAEGGSEQTLAVRKLPRRFYPIYFTGPSWSPDGEWIACAVADVTQFAGLYAFNVKDGTEKLLTRPIFSQGGRVEWLKDMTGLIFVATDQMTPSLPGQVWHVSYPGGELRRITNDLNSYRGLSMAADSTRLLTVSVSSFSNLWVVPDADAARAKQVSPVHDRGGVAWTPDGRVVYSTETGGAWDIWIMNADGSNRRQLTNGVGQNVDPQVSPDGRYIVFTSTRAGTVDTWRMDLQGGHAFQLTKDVFSVTPTFSPDGRWVVYKGGAKIWKIPVEGGTPVALTDRPAFRPVVSPDGRWLACFYNDVPVRTGAPFHKIAIIPFEGGPPVKMFDFEGNSTTRDVLQWTADSRAVVYNLMNDNVSNIWRQAVDGGAPLKITDFKDSLINDFAFSRDGRQLVCTRGTVIREAVMVTDLR